MPKKNVPDPGNVGAQNGSGAGAGTEASESASADRTWTRGNDPEAAAQALREANRGTSGGGLNQAVPKTTPSA